MTGGAIYNKDNGTIGNITGDFIGNSAGSSGGAIYNSKSTIGNITGDFIGNSAGDYGGAINNEGTIGNITGDFIGNSAGYGGAIFNTGTIGDITGDFIGNSAGYGGAIANTGTIGDITGDFIGNSAGYGGAIANTGTIGDITGDFIGNSAGYGGAIFNTGTIGDITGDFIGNSAGYGGAIANGGTIGSKDTDGTVVGGIINSSFYNNYAKSETDTAQGGAIYTASDLNIIAKDGYTSVFSGNYTESNGIKDDNAIYLEDGATLNFKMQNGGKIYMADNISWYKALTYDELKSEAENYGFICVEDYLQGRFGVRTYEEYTKLFEKSTVNIKGDDIDKTTFYMLNDIRNANVTFDNTTINAINNDVHVYNFNNLTINGDTKMVADVDLANEQMDRFTTTNGYGEHKGNLIVSGMNLLSDATKDVTEIYFAENGLKNNVVNGMTTVNGNNLPTTAYQTTFYTPIYKYNAIYDNTRDDGGYFVFTKGDKIFTPNGNGGSINSTGNPSDAFNPAVLATPVASQAAGQATVTEAFKYVFEHADAFTQLPSWDRLSHIKANQYALSTDYNNNLGPIATEFNNKAGWFRPYVSFEKMNLKNGPKVNAITYGSMAGYDGDFKAMKHGWTRLGTGYIGYTGSQLSYSGVDTSMNGGLLGGTETFYKGNFWTALTVTAGASVGQNRTMYGKEDFTTLLAGVGSKTGYNFEFKNGRYIIQPIWFMSYTFGKTFDYTNAAGVRIDSDPMHSIMLNPSVRFIMNTKDGWQPYASVGMVWNAMNDSNVTANGVTLPEASIKPYVEYGLGIQKRFKDKYTAFGQAMIRNGGRNGIALTLGFRYKFGNDGKTIKHQEKVSLPQTKVTLNGLKDTQSVAKSTVKDVAQTTGQSVKTSNTVESAKTANVVPERKIIKQMTQQQKVSLRLIKPQNTSLTTHKAAFKQL